MSEMELFKIIQLVMKCQKSGKGVDITLKSGDKVSGIIAEYTGEKLLLAIQSEDNMEIKLQDIEFIEEERIDLSGFMMQRVELVLVSGKVLDAVVISVDEAKLILVNEDGQTEAEISSIASISSGENKVILNDIKQETPAVGTVSEAGVTSAGATSNTANEDNTDISSVTTVTTVTTIEEIAEVLSDFSKGTKSYTDKLKELIDHVPDDNYELIIEIWNKYSVYLKRVVKYCDRYIKARLRAAGIVPNPFERQVINCGKNEIKKFISDEKELFNLGYTDNEIARIKTAYRKVGWESGWYKIASRIYMLQLNKNRLAEIYYEAALSIADRKDEDKNKMINTLAIIKPLSDNAGYIDFFNKYREVLKGNRNYVGSFANALMAEKNYVKLERDLPLFHEVLAGNPTLISKIEEEINFYKHMPAFDMANFPIISSRLNGDEELYDREKDFIEKLPDKNALKTLLEVYYFYKEEGAYFELAEYAMFFIKNYDSYMAKLLEMMKNTDKLDVIYKILPKVPVFWNEEELIKKYKAYEPIAEEATEQEVTAESVKAEENTEATEQEVTEEMTVAAEPNESSELTEDADQEATEEPVMTAAEKTYLYLRKRFQKHLETLGEFKEINEFENAIINCDLVTAKRCFNQEYLANLGYNDYEIEDILSTDLEAELSEDNYTLRRIMAFQGNENHTAERFIFDAYYSNRIDMCNRLFPLLLAEERADIVIGILKFDPRLCEKTPSLRRYYYTAQCIVEEDDDEFYRSLINTWREYPEEKILERMLRIAKEKNNDLLVKQLELQIQTPRENDFERAVMTADNVTIREYVTNANLLVDLGYTPEEIQRISKFFSQGGGNSDKKPGQVANRVYLYQKNKNHLAERLLLVALEKDSDEDLLYDANILFQIYMGQKDYENVCNIYEKYLSAEVEEKFNRAYASAYLLAQYELGKYEEFIKVFEHFRFRWGAFPFVANMLHACEILNISGYEDVILENIERATQKPEIVKKYLDLVIEKDKTRLHSQLNIKLISLVFDSFADSDLEDLMVKMNGENFEDVDDTQIREAGILKAMSNPESAGRYIYFWKDYMCSTVYLDDRYNKEADLIIKLAKTFPSETKGLTDVAVELYKKCLEILALSKNIDSSIGEDAAGEEGSGITTVSENKLATLVSFITENISESSAYEPWCDIQSEMFQRGIGSGKNLGAFYELLDKLGRKGEFWNVYKEFKKNSTHQNAEELFDTVWNIYESEKDSMDIEGKNDIYEELQALGGGDKLDYSRCKKIAEIAEETGHSFQAALYLETAERMIEGSGDGSENGEAVETKVDYLGYLLGVLSQKELLGTELSFEDVTSYIHFTEEDSAVVDRMQNSADSRELWSRNDVNTLAKAIIVTSDSFTYWGLLKMWAESADIDDELDSSIIMGNILYQMAKRNASRYDDALQFAIQQDLRTFAMNMVYQLLDMPQSFTNVMAQKNLRVMIEKGWFQENELEESDFKDKIEGLFIKIKDNISPEDADDVVWNSVSAATDLACATNRYDCYIEHYADYLTSECSKQCCVAIADMIIKQNTTYIDELIRFLDYAIEEVPYKQMVVDMYEKMKNQELTETDILAMKCMSSDYGNTLGIDFFMGFYTDMCMADRRQEGFDVINTFIRYSEMDPILYEIAGMFLRYESLTEDSRDRLEREKQYYNYMYKYLKYNPAKEAFPYFVGTLVCGENYLRKKATIVDSVLELARVVNPGVVEKVNRYQEFCDSLVADLRNSTYENFAEYILRAVMMGDWTPVFEKYYGEQLSPKTDNAPLLDVIIKAINTDRMNVVDEFYRSFVQSVARYCLKRHDFIGDVKGHSLIKTLWRTMGNVGCKRKVFMSAFENLDEASREELWRIWNLDIETITIFKKYFGRSILSQPNCYKYANAFLVFVETANGDIFNNPKARTYLRSIDEERRNAICTAYDKIYCQVAYANVKKNIVSTYERNVFSKFLIPVQPDYGSVERRYVRYHEKYMLQKKQFNVNSTFAGKYKYIAMGALDYFYSCIYDNSNVEAIDQELKVPTIINALILTISDEGHIENVPAFIDAFKSSSDLNDIMPIVRVVLDVKKEMVPEAANYIIEKAPEAFKPSLAGYVLANLGTCKLDYEVYGQVNKMRYAIGYPAFWFKESVFRPSKELIDSLESKLYESLKDGGAGASIGASIGDSVGDSNGVSTRDSIGDTIGASAGTLSGEAADSSVGASAGSISGSSADSSANSFKNVAATNEKVDDFEDDDEDEYDDEAMPLFIREFLETDLEDEYYVNLRNDWLTAKENFENNKSDINELNVISIKIGLKLLNQKKDKLDPEVMSEVFSLVRENGVNDARLVNGLHTIFLRYISGFNDIDSLIKGINKNRKSIIHLTYTQNIYRGQKTLQDIRAITAFIDVLIGIADSLSGDSVVILGEDYLKETLNNYQAELNNKTNSFSKFRSCSLTISRLIQEKIISLNNIPRLEINHSGAYSSDEQFVKWREEWTRNASEGHIQGIVHNRGGAAANDVELTITINSQSRKTFTIGRIDPGRKIPFSVPYDKEDITEDGKVNWSAYVKYPDGSAPHGYRDFIKNGEINVFLSEADWDESYSNAQEFEIQKSADSSNFFGRTGELLKFGKLFSVNVPHERYPSLLVTGLRRTGKSSLLKRFVDELKKREDVVPIFVDGQGVGNNIANVFFSLTINALFEKYMEEMKSGTEESKAFIAAFAEFQKKWAGMEKQEDWIDKLPTFFIELYGVLGNKKVIFIIDEMERIFFSDSLDTEQKQDTFYSMIRFLIQNFQEYVSFIFCGSDSLFIRCLEQRRESQVFQVLQRIVIRRMSIADIRELFGGYNSKYKIKFGEDAIEGIMHYANGHVWYTKILAKFIIDKIIEKDMILKDEIHLMDVDQIAEELIRGKLGAEFINLLDASLGVKRKAIIRAMAKATQRPYESVNADMVMSELEKLNYVDSTTGETVGIISMDELLEQLAMLEKLDFIVADAQTRNSYQFATEIYRLYYRGDYELDKFELKMQ